MELLIVPQEKMKPMKLHDDIVVRMEICLGIFQTNMPVFFYNRIPNTEADSWCLHNQLSEDLVA